MKKLSILLVILWMGFIFYNSSRNSVSSNETSFKFLNIFKQNTHIVLNNNTKTNAPKIAANDKQNNLPKSKKDKKQNLLIRKNAHAFEYIVLAILVSNLLITHGMKMNRAIIYILFISLFYAVTDEFHQQFVPGRSSLVSDVLIDFSGSILGLAIYYIYYIIKYKPAYKTLSS